MPTVSIITPVHNGVAYLREAIESVLSQTYRDWELFLVDDGSTDGSVDLAEEYVRRYAPQIRLFFHPDRKNHGVSATRNLVLDQGSGTYLAFLDADDVWLPHRLESEIKALEQHPDVGMVYGKALCIDENSKEVTQPTGSFGRMGELGGGVSYQPVHNYEVLLEPGYFDAPVATVLVRRALVLETGGFAVDLKLRGGEDQIMWILVAQRAPVLYLPECLALYRIHGTNWSSKQNAVSIVDVQLEVFTWLATHTRHMDRPIARAIIQIIGRYWRLEHVSLRLRLSRIREALQWLRAYGRLNEIPRVGVRKIVKKVRRMARWTRQRWNLTMKRDAL